MDKASDDNCQESKIQSDIFEDSFLKNLKGLQIKIKQQHLQEQRLQDSEKQSGDIQYIGDSTRKLVELKLLELDTLINAKKKEEDWIRKREIRAAQSDRIEQARHNLNTLMMLEEKGKEGLENDIENNLSILREVENIGSEEISIKDKIPTIPTTDKILESFHVTEKDIRRAFDNTNILEFMRQAKKNGWTLKITENEIALYNKQGKRIYDSPKGKDYINTEDKVSINKTATKSIKRKG